jgi:hypothetical protein
MKLKKPKIFFNPIAGSGILSITWYSGPLGDAIEANNEIGIGYFGHNGDLLSIQFDDVEAEKDQQALKFDQYTVEVKVNKGKVVYNLMQKKSQKRADADQPRN